MDGRNPVRTTKEAMETRTFVGIYVGESSQTRVSQVVQNGFRPSTVGVLFCGFGRKIDGDS